MKVSMKHGYVDAARLLYKNLCGLFVSHLLPSRVWFNERSTESSNDPPNQSNGRKDVYCNHMSWRQGRNLAVPSQAYLRTKKLVDILVSMFAFPMFLVVCILIWISNYLWSPGPLFFRQSRVGFKGKTFVIIKFRTMIANKGNAECLLTAEQDRRVTRVGKVLRRTRLDELPQLLNVLRGEMSWIGPRPEASSLSKLYQQAFSNYQSRYVILPGVTGLAQVSQGHVTCIQKTRHKLFYDLFFIRHTSLWLEVWIAMRTVQIMISGYGAR